MSDLFFYGTLRHLPLLALVLDRAEDALAPLTARLDGYACRAVTGHNFPMIEAQPGAAASGLLLRDLSDEDVARLAFYEGGFAFELRPLTVTTETGPAEARVFFPLGETWQAGAPWSLEGWQRDWGEITLLAAEEVMARYGHQSPEAVQALWPFFCARGWARILARDTAPQTLRASFRAEDMQRFETRYPFNGFFRMAEFDLQYPHFAGGTSDRITRESFIAFDAALVLPYDPATDQVLLIEQLRYGPLCRGDAAPWVLEPVAGLVEAGEDPAECVIREAREEAHIELSAVERMTRVYASPGYSTEFFHCYLGICDLEGRGMRLAGLDAENEDIRAHVLSFDDAMALFDSGEINAGPLAMMLLWLARARPGLRGAA
ncbi:NUDIX domain-containing protein [Litorisediminicola beolgyonensis]|uniref:ADP-ribose pyrophosphatase n=1 Tax=Litorisediminicola beolgyonensis TaxID=1173614 RepID=A0ABW3ZFT3_9RHOB